MDDVVDAVVVGAGVVGLAIAAELARRGQAVIVLEAETLIGSITSARNSEVIHAGLYYPPGSLKARLCVEGRRRLYDYCATRGVGHRRCGKLVVATEAAEVPAIERIAANGELSGVEDLRMIDGAALKALAPALTAVAALQSPVTGIVDSHALMLALQGEIEDAGGFIALGAPMLRGEHVAQGWQIDVGGQDPMRLVARRLVNAAGLDAQRVAAALEGVPDDTIPPRYVAKGSYFTLSGKPPADLLVYPAPSSAGLGIHLTLDLGGQARFGPDVEWVEGYDVDPDRVDSFVAAIRRYWPAVTADRLSPGYAGLRPKLVGPGEPAADFRIDGGSVHGFDDLVNLFGIESPGLTASLAIAGHVADLLNP